MKLKIIKQGKTVFNQFCKKFQRDVILQRWVSNPDIFRILVYSQLWYTLKSKHIQNPAKYVRWIVLLRTLRNYSKFRAPIYSKFSLIQNRSVFFRTTNY